MSQPKPRLRRTRIVCISDTHNCTVKLPKGDVLIHAGDMTNQGSYSELSRAVKWLQEAPFEAKIVIAGNHDVTLDKDFHQEFGHNFHSQNPQSHDDCLGLLTGAPGITYLDHASAVVRLSSSDGPRTQFKVFGSPYSPRHGLWAFGYEAPSTPSAFHELPKLWDAIPLDTDIVVTHTPARTHCDETDERRAKGCEALRRQLWRVRPRLAVCGHIHDGRGAQRVIWDLSARNVAFAERSVSRWSDETVGTSKISLVDLTGRKAPTLVNDGSPPSVSPHVTTKTATSYPIDASAGNKANATLSSKPGVIDAQLCDSTLGLGCDDDPGSPRCDREALRGRMGRQETCIVNAAIMKSRYPHVGGKQFNKPIVVDLDLPIWQQEL